MLKRCCCFNLYVGSLIIAVLRLLLWALLLIAIIYVAVQIFSPDNGLVPYRARVDIEQHRYLLFVIMVVTLGGLVIDSFLLHGIVTGKPKHLNCWYAVTVFTIITSIILALNFVLGILEIPSRPTTGRNFVFDAFCVLFHIVFFFIPEYLFGPRLTPVLIVIMIIVHIFLPAFHLYSFLVVRSYYKQQMYEYNEYLTKAMEEEQMAALANGQQSCQKNLCQKCQLAALEAANAGNANNPNGIAVTTAPSPMVKPFETTC